MYILWLIDIAKLVLHMSHTSLHSTAPQPTTSHHIKPHLTTLIPPRLTTPFSSEPSKQEVVHFPVNAHRVDTGFSFIPSHWDVMCEIPDVS